MKRTVSVRDGEGEPAEGEGPEHKRAKEGNGGGTDAVLELSVEDFECVICCGECNALSSQQIKPCYPDPGQGWVQLILGVCSLS